MKHEIIINKEEAREDYPPIIKDALEKVEDFFEEKISFKIIFLTTREEMDKIYSKMFGTPQKTEDWVVGGYFGKDTVYIFSEDSYSKVSCHKQDTFFSTLVHEIAHVFSDKILKFNLPMWFNEGLACVVAEQDNKKLKVKENLSKVYTEDEWMQTNPYLTSGKFVKFLINLKGKETILYFLKSLEFNEDKDSFNKKFTKMFGKSFGDIFNGWNPDEDKK